MHGSARSAIRHLNESCILEFGVGIVVSPFKEGEQELPLSTLASRKKVHPSTVHRWRQAGKLQAYRLGGRWFVTLEAWVSFLGRCNGETDESATTNFRTVAQRNKDEEQAARRCITLGC